MQIQSLYIKNYKSVENLTIQEIEQALILVGKNNVGKTVILDAILVAAGQREIQECDYKEPDHPVIIGGILMLDQKDLTRLHESGCVSKFKRYERWLEEFQERLPGYTSQENQDIGYLPFEYVALPDGKVRFTDCGKKDNPYLKEVFPKVYYIDHRRNITEFQQDILEQQAETSLGELRAGTCMFDRTRPCNHCFQCMGVIQKKAPCELTVYETTKLLEYKLVNTNLVAFSQRLNDCFCKNGGGNQQIAYQIELAVDQIFQVRTLIQDMEGDCYGSLEELSEGFKSIYLLSLLEAYMTTAEDTLSSIIMLEDPEMFLHPQLQKAASEILYRLSHKNQVMFSTHAPNMIFNFTSRQIKQVVKDAQYHTVVREGEDIDEILDDLGYAANDFMNVDFVFIVEGTQDSARLPLLLDRFYKQMLDERGELQRIAMIPTNSCTNIKTYANLKYMNKVYLKDQFLMVRDSDGKNPEELAGQLCNYYSEREHQDRNNIPRVTRRNVLILKYYSLENYFLNPEIMTKIGVVASEEEFYAILTAKWNEYLYKLVSAKRLCAKLGKQLHTSEDMKQYLEEIRIYVRGHNLYDIFYGKYRKREEEILKAYIKVAPKEEFADILEAMNQFVYFENRKL